MNISERIPSPKEQQQYGFSNGKRTNGLLGEQRPDQSGSGNHRGNGKVIGNTPSETMRIKISHPIPHQHAKVRIEEADRRRTKNDRQYYEVSHRRVLSGAPIRFERQDI